MERLTFKTNSDSVRGDIKFQHRYKKMAEWQIFALDYVIEKIEVPSQRRSAVFLACKKNLRAAKFALIDCEELNKLNVDYWFDRWNAANGTRKKPEYNN